MLSFMNNLPEHVFGVRASAEVDQEDLFSYVSPGEATGSKISELQDAIEWVSSKSDQS